MAARSSDEDELAELAAAPTARLSGEDDNP
jgi:hypothetical protein